MYKVLLLVIALMVTSCIASTNQNAKDTFDQVRNDKELYEYAYKQFLAHAEKEHNCKEVKILNQEFVSQEKMVLSEKWTAELCGKATKHIIIRAADKNGQMIVGVGNLDGDSKKSE